MIKRACKILYIPNKGYTSHCLCCSVATSLLDHDVSFINLKRHDQWKSDSVVEGYITISEPLYMERRHGLMCDVCVVVKSYWFDRSDVHGDTLNPVTPQSRR